MHGASCADIKSLYNHYNITSSNSSRPASFADVVINIDPDSPIAGLWYEQLLHDLKRAKEEVPGIQGYEFLVTSPAATQYETTQHSFQVFPVAVGITAVVVFVLIGVAFRSVIIPFRAVFSIGLTILLVYGAAIFVYEDGYLSFLNFNGLMPLKNASLSWIPPILSFSIVVGLGLDYDVFLLSRIIEARLTTLTTKDCSMTDHDSIIIGLSKTGSTITAAGCIMATAFSGLLFSAEPVLNQISFFLVFAVLVDTFLIRALFVPAIMTGLNTWNWFPRSMPSLNGRE